MDAHRRHRRASHPQLPPCAGSLERCISQAEPWPTGTLWLARTRPGSLKEDPERLGRVFRSTCKRESDSIADRWTWSCSWVGSCYGSLPTIRVMFLLLYFHSQLCHTCLVGYRLLEALLCLILVDFCRCRTLLAIFAPWRLVNRVRLFSEWELLVESFRYVC